MRTLVRPTMRAPFVVACLLAVVQTGCTSALTASYLREGLWEAADHAATEEDDRADSDGHDAAVATDGETPAATPDPAADRARREAALEEATARLSQLGSLDPAAEAALVATLQRTQPEDWPVVVDEFAVSLSAAAPLVPLAVAAAAPSADAPLTTEPPAPAAEPSSAATADAAATPADEESPVTSPPAPESAATDAGATPDTDPTPSPALAVRTACFASAVRAWGDVDRFAADRFRPGEEVIVYLELDELTAGSSPAGHTTCVDTVLRLVDGDGATLHTWRFEPLAETCGTRRRDYFARYMVRFPEALTPGACRVEATVTDTLAGATAVATLPLELVAAE